MFYFKLLGILTAISCATILALGFAHWIIDEIRIARAKKRAPVSRLKIEEGDAVEYPN